MKIATIAIATGLMAASAVPALAGPIDNRLNNQWQRINQGVYSGALTYKEEARLRRQNRRIRHRVRIARKTFGMQPWERREIIRSLNNASDRIYRLKHNHARRHFGRRHGKLRGKSGFSISFRF